MTEVKHQWQTSSQVSQNVTITVDTDIALRNRHKQICAQPSHFFFFYLGNRKKSIIKHISLVCRYSQTTNRLNIVHMRSLLYLEPQTLCISLRTSIKPRPIKNGSNNLVTTTN